MPARLVWAILVAALLATLFASCQAARQQGRKTSVLGFLRNNRKQPKRKNVKLGVSKKATNKLKESKAKKTKKGKQLRNMRQKQSRKEGSGRVPPQRVYTCNGTSLGDTCLSNLLNSLKVEKDKI